MTKTRKRAGLAAATALLALCLAAPAAQADPFGIQAFDAQASAGPGPAPPPNPGEPADPANFAPPYTQAGGHPYAVSAQIRLNRDPDPSNGLLWPSEPVRDVLVDSPPGLIGNPTAVAKCRMDQISVNLTEIPAPLCPPGSQVGFAYITFPVCLEPALCFGYSNGATSLYAMKAPPGIPARFAFNVAGTIVLLDAELRKTADSYALAVNSRAINEGLPIVGSTVVVWGTPGDPVHDPERACPGEHTPQEGGPACAAETPDPEPLLTLPTACEGPLRTVARADSWFNPGAFDLASSTSHLPPGLPEPQSGAFEAPLLDPSQWGALQGPSGCEQVPFEPSIAVRPTSTQADSPTGLEVDLTLPQDGLVDPQAIASSHLKDAVVTLSEGMSVNPAAADGLGACGLAQIALEEVAAPNCPPSSKIGTVAIETPVLERPVEGTVYLAAQKDNPFGSLLALYIVGEDPENGIFLKLAGRVTPTASGQLITSFDNQPQLPFEALHLVLKGGPRAPLINPRSCGSHTAAATLTPWSGNAPVSLTASFELTQGPGGQPCPNGGFDPRFSAGSQSPLAASFTPFSLRLSREDGSRELTGVSATLPKGLVGKLAGIPYCPEAALASVSGAEGTAAAQIASPSCPAASQVGRVTVGAGAGPSPFYLDTGRAYLAGPYKGAPLSMAILTPAKAGPFDLGSVLVRTALRVNPESAQITAVSDPLPLFLHGIALDLRDVRVDVDRPNFTLNPTNCEPMAVEAVIAGTGGASAARSERFQVANCADLGFKPRLSLRLSGPTHRSAYPRLRAVLTARKGDANIGRAQVTLPKTELLENAHIGTICTRVQYAAHACPARSVYGYARAWSPLLDQPLQGPVYLRSSSNPLPDLVASLDGQIHVDLVGRIDSVNARIRNTFEVVPDAPVSKFVLTMQGGKKGLLVNNTELCKAKPKATASFTAQSGKEALLKPVVKVGCGKQGKGRKR